MNNNLPILSSHKLSKSFYDAHKELVVLKDIDFLADSINRISDAIKKSDAAQEKLKSRIHTSQRRR